MWRQESPGNRTDGTLKSTSTQWATTLGHRRGSLRSSMVTNTLVKSALCLEFPWSRIWQYFESKMFGRGYGIKSLRPGKLKEICRILQNPSDLRSEESLGTFYVKDVLICRAWLGNKMLWTSEGHRKHDLRHLKITVLFGLDVFMFVLFWSCDRCTGFLIGSGSVEDGAIWRLPSESQLLGIQNKVSLSKTPNPLMLHWCLAIRHGGGIA